MSKANGHSLTADERLQLVEDGVASPMEAEDYLSIGKTQLYALMNQGLLPWLKVGRSRRIPWRALRQFAANQLKTE